MTWSRSALAGSLCAILCCPCHFALTQAAESEDLDHYGLPDALEQQLAERYAPVVYHVSDEPNLPTDAGLFLHTAELWYYDPNCRPVSRRISSLMEGTVPRLHMDPCCQGDPPVDSWTTRSAAKTRTFYLKDLPPNDRRGSSDPAWWTTYFHAYPNNLGGVTIQYWRFYSYNTSEFLGHTAEGVACGSESSARRKLVLSVISCHAAVAGHFVRCRRKCEASVCELWSAILLKRTHRISLVRVGAGYDWKDIYYIGG